MVKEENVSITSWRGIACILVMLHHFFSPSVLWTGIDIHSSTGIFSKSYLWVDFFFMISGFIFTYVYEDQFITRQSRVEYFKFIAARAARLYPLHLTIIAAFILLELYKLATAQDAFSGAFSFKYLLMNATFTQAFSFNIFLAPWNGPSWSICAEWWSYLCLPFIIRFYVSVANKGNLKCFLTYATSAIIIFSYLYFICAYYPNGNLDVAGIPGTLRCFLLVCLGVMTFKVAPFLPEKLKLATLPLGIIWVSLSLHFEVYDLIIFPGFLAILLGSNSKGLINKVLSQPLFIKIGNLSFSLYMVHFWVLYLMHNLTKDSGVTLFNGQTVAEISSSLLIYFGISIPLAVLLYNRIEVPFRSKVKKQLNKIVSKKFARTQSSRFAT